MADLFGRLAVRLQGAGADPVAPHVAARFAPSPLTGVIADAAPSPHVDPVGATGITHVGFPRPTSPSRPPVVDAPSPPVRTVAETVRRRRPTAPTGPQTAVG